MSKTWQWTISFVAFTYVSPSVHVTLNIVNIWGCCFYVKESGSYVWHRHAKQTFQQLPLPKWQRVQTWQRIRARKHAPREQNDNAIISWDYVSAHFSETRPQQSNDWVPTKQPSTGGSTGTQWYNDRSHTHASWPTSKAACLWSCSLGSIHEICAFFHCFLAYFSHLFSGVFQPFD